MGRRQRSRDDGDDREGQPRARGLGRYLFYFMGPPEVGDPSAPRTAPVSTVPQLCVSCGKPMTEHVIDRSHGKSATRCP